MLFTAQAIAYVKLFLDEEEIVYVDTTVLLENYEGMKEARAAFQQKAVLWQANIDTLKSELDQKVRAFESEQATMTAKEKALSQELIKTKQQQLVDYQQGIQQKYQQEDYAMTEQVLTQVNAFIASYGKEKGYKMILGANNSGNIVYAREALDITADLQKALNDNYLGF